MTRDLLLGFDLGTTHAKAAVVTLDGRERGHGSAPTPWRTVPTGAEMDPRALVEAAVTAARAALAAEPDGRVIGVGATSMAETGALLDRDGGPVTPMIAWHDTRGDEEAGDLARAVGSEWFSRRAGLPMSRLCTASKYRWMRTQLPGAKEGVRWLNVAEWLVRSLGGDELAELSLSSRTGFLDLSRRGWLDEVLDAVEAPAGFLPDPTDAGTPAGTVSRALDEARGAVLTVAGHDHPCAAVGGGATEPGDVFDSCGTAEAFVRALGAPLDPDDVGRVVAGGVTVGWSAVPNQQALMAGFVSGLALTRFLDLLGVGDQGRTALDSAAVALRSGAGGVSVAGVTGDRATLEGIPRSVTPGHVWRAAIEAVTRHGEQVLETIESVAGPTTRLVVSGGWARNVAVRAVKREILGPFVEPAVEEAGARGAALMAGIAAGVFSGIEDLPPVARRDEG